MSIVLTDDTFQNLLIDTLLELFFEKYYDDILKNNQFRVDCPVYYFRFNKRTDLLIAIGTFTINEQYNFSKWQKSLLDSFSSKLNAWVFDFDLEISKYTNDFKFFFREQFAYANSDPIIEAYNEDKTLSKEQLTVLLKKYPSNLFLWQALMLVEYDLHNFENLQKIYSLLLRLDSGNPFILLGRSRLLGSVLWKTTSNRKLLDQAEQDIELAIINLWTDSDYFTFIYAWLGQILMAKQLYLESIVLYDKTIQLNESQSLVKIEPYLWKADAFTKLWKFKESQDLYDHIYLDTQSLVEDFRYYRSIAMNSWGLNDITKFREYFLKSICSLFQKEHEFIITLNWVQSIVSTFQSILSTDQALLNDFDSFSIYYRNNVLEELENWIAFQIYTIWWLYLKNSMNTFTVNFHNSRDLEKYCFLFLQSYVYEKSWFWK